jgi:hypothetical protein
LGLASITTTGGNLAVTSIGSVTGNGVTLTATGAGSGIALGGGVNAGTGTATLSAGGDITSSIVGNYAVQGNSVSLNSGGGALGSALAQLEIGTSNLDAVGTNGIFLDLNAFSPVFATVNTLRNTTSGDIIVNAHGGARFLTLVDNPHGNVSITTFSPLDIMAGINAGSSISLTTSGTGSNDMFLDGTFTNNALGGFDVVLGPTGVLTHGANFSRVIIGATPAPDPILNLALNTTNNSTNTATNTQQVTVTTEEVEKKEKENKQKKDAPVCK